MPKTRVAVLFGGRSGEHEVSLRSAASVIAALDRSLYDVVPLAISPEGRWLNPGDSLALLPEPVAGVVAGETAVTLSKEPGSSAGFDVVFPVLHGTFGEDGTVQGFLELAGVPYVGCGVLGSACAMDKDVMKRLFRERGLPTPEHLTFLRSQLSAAVPAVEKHFSYPVFVKPANLGSSVGISKARNRAELEAALSLAARFDRKLIVERAVDAREIECAVLGNDAPEASVAGEIVPGHEFYDYEAKYADTGSKLLIPAPLSDAQSAELRRLAVEAFQAVEGAGLARVDFFLERETGEILVNEINTMPGFTSISMYPKLWEASGLPYPALIQRLIELAIERHRERGETVFSRQP